MDRSIVLSLLGLLLIVAVVVNTLYSEELARKWRVDPTASMVNTGAGSIRGIIKPPETRVVEYQDKRIILLDNTSKSDEDALLTDSKFRNALDSKDRLLLYTSQNGLNAVVASHYFNSAEVEMLSMDERVTKVLEIYHLPGRVNLSRIDVSDPTNARVDVVQVSGSWVSLLVPGGVSSENLSAMAGSDEFDKVVGDSGRLKNKTLLLYHPSNSIFNIIIPVNFSSDEVSLLAKNSAVKTAIDLMDIKNGETLDLARTKEFQQTNMAQLPYQPDTRVYVSFNIRGELGFLSEDMLIYLAVFVVALVMFYVLYSILIA
jgi:hypothetical protein